MKETYIKFDNLHLFGIPKCVNLRSVLSLKAADAESNPIRLYNSLGGLYYYFHDSLIKERHYQSIKKEGSHFLLFYGIYNLRKDHQKTFLGFADRFIDADVFYASFLEKKKITIGRFFKCLCFFLIWMAQMLLHRISLYEACNALPFVLLCYDTNKNVKQLLTRKYRFVVVYYDASPDENCFVQMCKEKRITSMTLQHGIFARKSVVHTITDTAFELSSSISDYYLAWNEYTKDEAIKVGLKPERVIVLGAPKYINTKEPELPYKADNDIFGVILNNSAFDTHNRHLIDMANQIYKITGKRYILRYHPQMKGDEYRNLYGDGFLKKDDNAHTIGEYAKEVSFTIISSSSVFVDLLLLKHPTYRLKVFEEDTYSSVDFNSFSTVEELLEVMKSKTVDNKAFLYLCNSYNTFDNYRSFFDNVLLDIE